MAEAAKERGNALMASGDVEAALVAYTEAIQISPAMHVYYSNRSAAYLKLDKFDEAVADARKCVQLKPDWGKGYVRLGQSLFYAGRAAEAVEAYQSGLEFEPSNASLKQGLEEARARAAELAAKRRNKNQGGSSSGSSSNAGFTEEAKCVVGIDLGTTYSCVGVWENEGVTIIPDSEGRLTTPSVVSFTVLPDGSVERRIGHDAKRQMSTNPKGTIFDAKRLIGQMFNDVSVQRDVAKFPFQVREAEETGKPEIVVPNGPTLTPEEISAMVLSEMKKIAENYLKKRVTRAVVTVPAYFSDAQRQATKDAGKIAGLDVLRVVNEPTAAALAYGLDAKLTSTEGKTEEAQAAPKKVLVFDLGGGTFDVSILTIEGGVFEVVATGGDTHLGGEDFDNNLAELIAKEIKRLHPAAADAVEAKRNRLRVLAESAKVTLSAAQSTRVALDSFGLDGASVEITRAQFEKVNAEPFKRCMDTVKNVMKDAKCAVEDVAEIVLVGGSTRIPAIREMLRAMFNGKALCQSINPDEAVAYGAAVQGQIMSQSGPSSATADLILVDVTPLSLGIECTGKVFSVVIPRNTTLPVARTKTYTTEDDFQTEIDVRIFEGERPITDNNNFLGEFTITGIERAKRGVPQVEVSFAVSVDGMLKVTARDVKTGSFADVVIAKNAGRLSEKQIARMVADAEKFRLADEARVNRMEALNELDAFVRELEQDTASRVVKAVVGVKTWLEGIDTDTVDANVVRRRIDQLALEAGRG